MPLTHNDGRPVSPEKLKQTREEIVAEFGAISISPSPIQGIWAHEGKRYEEESIRFTIDVDDTLENQQFFLQLKAGLLERFEQIEIYIASYPVDIV